MSQKESAFDHFYREQTPVNAVRLAIADAMAQKMKPWEFHDALREAEKQLEAHEDLLVALSACEKALSFPSNQEQRDALALIHAAKARACTK